MYQVQISTIYWHLWDTKFLRVSTSKTYFCRSYWGGKKNKKSSLPRKHIFLANFSKWCNIMKKNKNRTCDTVYRYGILFSPAISFRNNPFLSIFRQQRYFFTLSSFQQSDKTICWTIVLSSYLRGRIEKFPTWLRK